jgi:hypothetical protein
MTAPMGADIVDVLERAGERYLGRTQSKAHAAFLLQVGGTDALRAYDASETYWERVQAVLDAFFSSAERAEICAWLIDRPELRARPEFQGFLGHALAERRMQELIAAAVMASTARGRPPLAAVRRGG